MDSIVDRLTRIANRCEATASELRASSDIDRPLKALADATNQLDKCSSGSFLGYQSCVYTEGFVDPPPGWHFDVGAGFDSAFSDTYGQWREYTEAEVDAELSRRSKRVDLDQLVLAGVTAEKTFAAAKRETVPLIEAYLSSNPDAFVDSIKKQIAELEILRARSFMRARFPKEVRTGDDRAAQGGFVAPPHVRVRASLFEVEQSFLRCRSLAELIVQIVGYLEAKKGMTGSSAARKTGPIFVGHGRSPVWKELRELLERRIRVQTKEYNDDATAGFSRKERILQLLETCCFAFLVMTAEDEQGDGSLRARQNVVHEVGLFQGRYGFERAIILLEEGCADFSNIDGLDQIRFTRGKIAEKSEDIRKVLEREDLIR